MLTESHFERVRDRLTTGTSVLVKGWFTDGGPSALDTEWNHRIVTAESLDVLYGTLRQRRSFRLPVELESVAD
jgi:hypothetical protein